MSYYAESLELSFDLPASSVTRAAGGFTADDEEVIGRWVERSTDNTVLLLGAAGRPFGVITRMSSGKVAVAVGTVVRGKRGQDAVIPVGSRVTGATRKESATGVAERGFVSAGTTTNVVNLSNSEGYVISQDEATVADTPAGYVDVVMR